jgi:hypothetical protein
MVSFFSENYYAYHYSNVFSNAFIFMVVLIIISILLPFFTNIGVLDKFWKPITVFTDHPIVQFKNEFNIVLSGENTPEDFNTLKNNVNYYQIESNEKKIRIFGNVDYQSAKDIKFFIFFDYYMIDKVNVHIRAKAHIFYSSSDTFSSITTDGDLVLKQNKGLVETYFMDNQGTNSDLETEINEAKENPFSRDSDYYFEYKKNNIYVVKGDGSNLEFDFTFNIPYYEDIFVQLPNYTNLKNKWVLYSILFFPTVFICYKLMELAIENQIFKTRIKSDIPIRI